ncbi:DHHC palmitoyltransferase-domain-containing protein [Catenaria anguillulae PL171]|uniref:Palmitoyltransferase n=1 Tax=Catenaria anguillulae PL171 TaxID=765915 RepID=A0A1Y2I3Y0_9FUNG|nr:DHHC palmitoyltransferase-domain-containing protein [Catenaria anguillulae PL171]
MDPHRNRRPRPRRLPLPHALGPFRFLQEHARPHGLHPPHYHAAVLLSRLAHRILGQRIVSWCTRCVHWIGYERNPLVQIFFLAIVTAGVGIFAYSGWNRLEPLGFAIGHKWVWAATGCGVLWVLCGSMSRDPGRISDKDQAEAWGKVWPCDNILYFDGHECRTCLFEKPARSKHCSLCKACIARNDHHCVWINQCVGNANQPHFIAFLVCTTWIAAYTAYLSLAIAIHDLAMHGWIEFGKSSWWELQCYRFGYQQTGRWVRYPVDWAEGFSLALLIDPALIALGLFLIFATLIVAAFLAHHLWLNVIKGTTTNESHKWADVYDAIKYNEVCFARDAARGGKIVLTDVKSVKDEADKVKDKKLWPRHAYDAGVWNNLVEVIWPKRIEGLAGPAQDGNVVGAPLERASGKAVARRTG